MPRKEEILSLWRRTQDYLFNQRPAFEREGADGYKPGLDVSLALDKLYHSPHRNYRIIHIAGTNGKGSTAHTLASCLWQCGYRVGLFTSPHLVDFRERIRVNGRKVSRTYVMNWVKAYKEKNIQSMEPSFFELVSTMAFDYFAHRRVDVAVIETGLGGRLDSTNIITPDLSIITNIGLEHQQFLGNTIEEIALEKAGIIKPGRPVVIGHADEIIRAVMNEVAKKNSAEIVFAEDQPEVLDAKHYGNVLRLGTKNYRTIDYELTGDYQVENANTVLIALDMLKRLDFKINDRSVRYGFANVARNTGLMGRWMKLNDIPLVICDSAHNPPGMQQAMKQLKDGGHSKLHLVLGFMADKDVQAMLKMMPKKARFYFTQAQTSRSMSAEELRNQAREIGINGRIYNNVADAYEKAKYNASPYGTVYVGGSMYVLAELLTYLGYNR